MSHKERSGLGRVGLYLLATLFPPLFEFRYRIMTRNMEVVPGKIWRWLDCHGGVRSGFETIETAVLWEDPVRFVNLKHPIRRYRPPLVSNISPTVIFITSPLGEALHTTYQFPPSFRSHRNFRIYHLHVPLTWPGVGRHSLPGCQFPPVRSRFTCKPTNLRLRCL